MFRSVANTLAAAAVVLQYGGTDEHHLSPVPRNQCSLQLSQSFSSASLFQ